jgi:hypothetical protein
MAQRQRSPITHLRIASALAVLAVATLAAVWGSGSARGADPAYYSLVRDAVVRGVGRDFTAGTGAGGPAFDSCLKTRMHDALIPPRIAGLAPVYRRPGGPPYAAQALNAIASPLAARCGHRYMVPELTGAARGLAKTHATGASVRKLGVTYGPYLGLRCRPPVTKADCERIGIDIVLRRAATNVVAVAGDQKIHLRTPGRHDGVRAHDWVGTFTHAGIAPGSYEPGTNVTWIELDLRVRFADGTRRHAVFPHVLLAPGWG